MASLQVRNGNRWQHFCGASLIAADTLLTAAHCVQYLPARPGKNYRAVLGRYVLSSGATQGVVTRALSRVLMHPSYFAMNNDIALVKVAAIARARTIGLAAAAPPAATMLAVIGWGYTAEGSGRTSDVLMRVAVPLVAQSVCKQSYPAVGAQNVCAGYRQGLKDACSGDSGGPLFLNRSGDVQQVGVVSYGRGCAQPNYYGVYTSVPYYRNWIQTNSLGEDGSPPAGVPTS